MGNAGRKLSLAEQGRRPNDKELLVLYKMQRALFQRLVASPEHLQLLQRYWTSSFCRKHQMPGFVLVSDLWKETGFSASNPAIDLNATGKLGLQCLVFFVETYPAETAMMRRGRGGYQFAKAAVAMVRALSLLLHLMDTTGNPGPFPVTKTLVWQLFQHERDFFQLFALAFLAFEELFCKEVMANLWMRDLDACSMRVVDKVVAAVERKLATKFQTAPLELADLQDLCRNGRYIVDKTMEHRRAGVMDKSTDRESRFVSRWSQHHTSKRKSMHEMGQTWGKEKIEVSLEGQGYRLKPRIPEIEHHRSEGSQANEATNVSPRRSGDNVSNDTTSESAQDLFAGLTTKFAMSLTESKNNEHRESLETPAPIA